MSYITSLKKPMCTSLRVVVPALLSVMTNVAHVGCGGIASSSHTIASSVYSLSFDLASMSPSAWDISMYGAVLSTTCISASTQSLKICAPSFSHMVAFCSAAAKRASADPSMRSARCW